MITMSRWRLVAGHPRGHALGFLATVLCLAVGLAACPSAVPPAADALDEPSRPTWPEVTGSIRVLTDEAFSPTMLAAVRSQQPGLSFEVVRAEAGAVPAAQTEAVDVVLLAHPADMRPLDRAGVLAAIDPDLLTQVPPRFRGPGGRYMALSVRARVIVAKRLMANRPLSILDLSDSRWRLKVARTRAADPAFLEGIAGTLGTYGEGKTLRFLGGFVANTDGMDPAADHAAVIQAVVARNVPLGLVDHVDFHRHALPAFDAGTDRPTAEQAVAQASVEALYPDRESTGVPWSASLAAVTLGTEKSDAAHAFLSTLLSPAGQEAYAWGRREYPAVAGMDGPPGTVSPSGFAWSDAGLTERAYHWDGAARLAAEMDGTILPDPPPEPRSEAPSDPEPESEPGLAPPAGG